MTKERPRLRCPACSSVRWTARTWNRGVTRWAQCVPCKTLIAQLPRGRW